MLYIRIFVIITKNQQRRCQLTSHMSISEPKRLKTTNGLKNITDNKISLNKLNDKFGDSRSDDKSEINLCTNEYTSNQMAKINLEQKLTLKRSFYARINIFDRTLSSKSYTLKQNANRPEIKLNVFKQPNLDNKINNNSNCKLINSSNSFIKTGNRCCESRNGHQEDDLMIEANGEIRKDNDQLDYNESNNVQSNSIKQSNVGCKEERDLSLKRKHQLLNKFKCKNSLSSDHCTSCNPHSSCLINNIKQDDNNSKNSSSHNVDSSNESNELTNETNLNDLDNLISAKCNHHLSSSYLAKKNSTCSSKSDRSFRSVEIKDELPNCDQKRLENSLSTTESPTKLTTTTAATTSRFNYPRKLKNKLNASIHNSKSIRFQTKALITTLTILGTYLVCIMPALVFLVLTCVDGCAYPLFSISIKRRVVISVVVNSLVIIKSIMDPFIYVYRIHEVKLAVRQCSIYKFFFRTQTKSNVGRTQMVKATAKQPYTPINAAAQRSKSLLLNKDSSLSKDASNTLVVEANLDSTVSTVH